ncbi:hypothetical protein QP445_14270, partial [Micrococcus luteus]|nr:hypothetical protein [Micrococcus luteus]
LEDKKKHLKLDFEPEPNAQAAQPTVSSPATAVDTQATALRSAEESSSAPMNSSPEELDQARQKPSTEESDPMPLTEALTPSSGSDVDDVLEASQPTA